LICANDLSAIGAMRTLAEHGLTPGRDLSLVGLDDIDLCTMVTPQLTTLRIPRERLVKLYFQALTGLTRKPHQLGAQFFQDVELVVRGTTGPVRRS
jgi:DNA-binding LacI/PurR family transcriptional regulator